MGSLFLKNFRRKQVDSTEYFCRLVWYIHNNPVKHGICNDFKTYKWSSYASLLSSKKSKLNKKEVMEWFGDRENFEVYHSQMTEDFEMLDEVMLE